MKWICQNISLIGAVPIEKVEHFALEINIYSWKQMFKNFKK